MGIVTEGFFGRSRGDDGRLPPGQYLTTDFPVLSAGPTPHVTQADWTFRVRTETGATREWSWDEIHELPVDDVTVDIHCVTRWSQLDTTWRGVSLDHLLADVDSAARLRPRPLLRRLHDQPSARRPSQRPGVDCLRVRRR